MFVNKNNPYSFSKKILGIIAVLSIIFFVFSSSVYNLFISKIQENNINSVKTSLERISSQNVERVNEIFSSTINKMNNIADIARDYLDMPQEDIVKGLYNIVEIEGFYNIGLTNRDGVCITTLDERLQLGQYDYIKECFEGAYGFTESQLSEDGRANLNIFYVPVYNNEGEIPYVLTATYTSKAMSSLLDITSYEQQGNSVVVDSNSNMITRTLVSTGKDLNIFDKPAQYADTYKVFSENFEKSDKGYVTYTYANQKYIAYYSQLKYENWYLITYVPYNNVFNVANNNTVLLKNAMNYVRIFVSCLMAVIFLAYIHYTKKFNDYIYKDSVTKKHNYTYLKRIFSNFSDEENNKKAICVMDIDNFKIVNTRFGKEAGDNVIIKVYKAFTEILPNDSIYRDTGDLFVCTINYDNINDITDKLNLFMDKIDSEIALRNIPYIHISVGIALYKNYDSIDSAFNDALIAKSKIKGNLKRFYNFTNKEERELIEESKEIEARFNDALKKQEFEVWYQPKYDGRTGKIVGAEALVRWKKEDGTIVPPNKFIPVYENNGQIIELDMEVLRLTCENIYNLKKKGVKLVPISVNLSRFQVENGDFERNLLDIIKKYDITPQDIQFELTETKMFNSEKIMRLISVLKKHNFEVHMDDFGTGVSGLQTLSNYEFDVAKIDKSFIDRIGEKKFDSIIKGMIVLCQNLDVQVVAEGIETKEQSDFLESNGCYVFQGYYYSKPVPEEEFNKLMEDSNNIDDSEK